MTTDEEVIRMTSGVLLVMGSFYFFDGFQCYVAGPIRGLNMQKRASCGALVSYYLVGIPIAVVLGFSKDLGVYGL